MKTPSFDLIPSIHYETSRYLDLDGELENEFVLTIRGTVYGEPDGVELDGVRPKLGSLRFYIIQVGNAYNEGTSLRSVFDTYQQTMDAGCAIFDDSFENFCPWIRRRFDDAYPSDDLLLLDRLTLDPVVRGQRLGLAVIDRTIRDWSKGCSLVVMKPFPLQYEGGWNEKNVTELKLQGFRARKTEAFKRLREYYVRLGFERVGRTDFYAPCTHHKRPSERELRIPATIKVPANFIPVNFEETND
jgi:hypothetical protein